MEPIEIIVIICCVGIVGGVIGNYIYRKIHHLPTGECACCGSKGKNLLKKYKKAQKKEQKCSCYKK